MVQHLRVGVAAASALFLLLACGSEPSTEAGSEGESAGESGTGDGDGDGDSGDGDGDSSTGDGDGDGDGECPPPDPAPAQTLEGAWAELPAPTLGFTCTLDNGDGPAWNEGVIVSEAEAGIEHVAIGSDGKLYAAGWIDDGLGALIAGVGLAGNPNNGELWARSWSYEGDPWPARGMAAVDGRIWLNLAPEHLLAVSEAGDLLDGPLETFVPGMRYMAALEAGDGKLLLAAVDRGGPPDCLDRTRLQYADPATATLGEVSGVVVTTSVIGIGDDGSGGGWITVLDLNGAAVTATHYDAAADLLGSFSVTNMAANVIAADMAVAGNGDPIFALRSIEGIEVHRHAADGTQLWMTLVPSFAGNYGAPQLAIDGSGAVVVAATTGSGFTLARIQASGAVDFAGYWSCGSDAVELRDVAVSGNGGEIWVGGVQTGATATAYLGSW